jgi:hypothetical protein
MKTTILSLLLALPLSAATITGNVRDTALAPAATNVYFTPLSTPMAVPPSVIFSRVQTAASDALGDFSLPLAPGNYRVTIGSNVHDAFIISVPDDAATHAWTDLATGTLTYRYPFSPAYVDRIIATTRGDLFVFDGAAVARLGAGTAGQVLASDAAAGVGLRWRDPGELAPPLWLQAVVAETSNYFTSTILMPVDDTLPQSTEGAAILSATITPRAAGNFLHVQFTGMVNANATLAAVTALFRENETAALAVSADTIFSTHLRMISLSARVPCQSTNAQTFKIRMGPGTTGTLFLNGNGSSRLFGGAAMQRLVITETQ